MALRKIPIGRKRKCAVGQHQALVPVHADPPVFFCPVCGWYLEDERGVFAYGQDEPVFADS